MNPAVVTAPSPVLYRVGPRAAPVAFRPPRNPALHRFDDPEALFSILYAAETRRACFLEILAGQRPDLRVLAALAAFDKNEDLFEVDTEVPGFDPTQGKVPKDWPTSRAVSSFTVDSGRFLDLRKLVTRQVVRRLAAPLLVMFDVSDYDTGNAMSILRPISQAIARWAYEEAYQGIIYPSRIEPEQSCWAIFNTAAPVNISAQVISPTDTDLVAVMQDFGLVWDD